MSNFSSQGGRIIVRTQAGPGVFATDLATEGLVYKIRGGSLDPSRDLVIADPEIGGGRDIADALLGPVMWSGEYNFYTRLDGITTWLAAALGVVVDGTPASGITTHTITPSDGAALPFLSIEEQIGAGLECFHYTDVVVNTLHLEADAGGLVMGTVGLIAMRQVAGITPTVDDDLTFDNSALQIGTNVTFSYNGVDLKGKSFKLDINNNFESDDFRLGSLYLGGLTPKRREVTANVTVRPEDSSLWRRAVYGSPSATAPGGVTTKQQVIITASTYDFISGTTPRSMTVTIPKAALKPYGFGANGDDIIQNDVDIQALRPDTATPILTAVVVNGQADTK